jgi:hypothetical protein
VIDPPDKAALLDAIALFLAGELKGAVADSRLGFRVLIAAHLTSTVAAELRGEAADDGAEWERLRALLPDAAAAARPVERAALRAEIAQLNGELAARLRDRRIAGAAALTALQETLAEKLRVVSPRFDLRPEIE